MLQTDPLHTAAGIIRLKPICTRTKFRRKFWRLVAFVSACREIRGRVTFGGRRSQVWRDPSPHELRALERGKRIANQDAVPSTGKGKRGAWRWLRHPRNVGVKRALLAIVGSLRGVAVPPSNWDDIPRAAGRNWKRYRRTQWRDE